MSADFFSIAAPVDPQDTFPQLAASEETWQDNVFLDVDPGDLEGMGIHIEGVAMSPNYPVFVALDRFGDPARTLLGGHAWRRVRHADLPAWRATWAALRDAPGLVARVAPHLDRYGNGVDDVREGIRVLDEATLIAEGSGLDLLLVCCRS